MKCAETETEEQMNTGNTDNKAEIFAPSSAYLIILCLWCLSQKKTPFCYFWALSCLNRNNDDIVSWCCIWDLSNRNDMTPL